MSFDANLTKKPFNKLYYACKSENSEKLLYVGSHFLQENMHFKDYIFNLLFPFFTKVPVVSNTVSTNRDFPDIWISPKYAVQIKIDSLNLSENSRLCRDEFSQKLYILLVI